MPTAEQKARRRRRQLYLEAKERAATSRAGSPNADPLQPESSSATLLPVAAAGGGSTASGKARGAGDGATSSGAASGGDSGDGDDVFDEEKDMELTGKRGRGCALLPLPSSAAAAGSGAASARSARGLKPQVYHGAKRGAHTPAGSRVASSATSAPDTGEEEDMELTGKRGRGGALLPLHYSKTRNPCRFY